jgi:hypothetical protein
MKIIQITPRVTIPSLQKRDIVKTLFLDIVNTGKWSLKWSFINYNYDLHSKTNSYIWILNNEMKFPSPIEIYLYDVFPPYSVVMKYRNNNTRIQKAYSEQTFEPLHNSEIYRGSIRLLPDPRALRNRWSVLSQECNLDSRAYTGIQLMIEGNDDSERGSWRVAVAVNSIGDRKTGFVWPIRSAYWNSERMEINDRGIGVHWPPGWRNPKAKKRGYLDPQSTFENPQKGGDFASKSQRLRMTRRVVSRIRILTIEYDTNI